MPPETRARPLTGGSKFMELMKKARKAGVVSKGLRAVAPHTKRSALLEKIAGVAEVKDMVGAVESQDEGPVWISSKQKQNRRGSLLRIKN